MSLLLRLFAQPEPPHKLIAPGPRLGMARSLRVFSFGVAIFYSLIFCIVTLIELLVTPGAVQFPWIMLFLMLMFLPNAILGSVQARYWQRIEPWRFAAALGNERLLADEQPEPRPAALPLPTMIRVRLMIERRYFIRCFAIFTCICAFGVYIFCSIIPPFQLFWAWSLLITVLLIGLFLISLFFMTRVRYPMEVTEDGIRFRSANRVFTQVFWHEMRFFACYPEPGARNGDAATVYELSSASYTIYWVWMPRKSLLNTIMGPSMPIEEHNLQMRALCSLISAKTGLPLYDLGKEQTLRLEETSGSHAG